MRLPPCGALSPRRLCLKIVELASFDVPAGLLEFPIEGLEPPAPANHGVQLWRGHVKYAGTRQASFWARVEVTVQYTGCCGRTRFAAG